MQPLEVLGLVRRGYAVATPPQARLVRRCLDVEVVGEEWVPRWALEAEAALEQAGYAAERIAAVFSAGRGAVLAELRALVGAGRRPRIIEPRRPFSPMPFDRLTEAKLSSALRRHAASCRRCLAGDRCEEAGEIAGALALLFPRDRRARPRP